MTRSKRKAEHLKHALKTGQKRLSGFEDIHFVHDSIPQTALNQIQISSHVGELTLSSPIFINAMTGGGGEATYQINKQLGFVANKTGVAVAVGSQMAALRDEKERRTFEVVREQNPNGIVIANLGMEATIEQAKTAVEMIAANALQIHVNVVQELTMPEGDRDFRTALDNIQSIVEKLEVPVIVKEVGFGMSKDTVAQLFASGVHIVDVGGYGGTNFAEIENERRTRLLHFFNEWGIPTAVSIVEAKSVAITKPIIASGGIQTSLDVVKSLALGADAVGMAGMFLRILIDQGPSALIEQIKMMHEDLKIMMVALGANNISELQQVPLIISGKTYHWLTERGLDTTYYSRRNK